jgi:hypothetical protein
VLAKIYRNPLNDGIMITVYPEWHRNPLKLSREQMDKPFTVLHDFFLCHSLTGVRTSLDRWLIESLRANEEDAAGYIELNEAIQKLVEAAWVINQQPATNPGKKKKKKN